MDLSNFGGYPKVTKDVGMRFFIAENLSGPRGVFATSLDAHNSTLKKVMFFVIDLPYASFFSTWVSSELPPGCLNCHDYCSKYLAVRCIHNATAHESEKLVVMWQSRRPYEAKQVLGAPDVVLTCAGDRFVQFEKIDTLDRDVRVAM